MKRINTICNTLYALISGGLIFIAMALMVVALWNAGWGFFSNGDPVTTLLDAVGLIVISMAIVDVGKYLFEEEVQRSRELRSALEARQSLTKFMVIVCIAVALEGLVHISLAMKSPGGSLLQPALLLVSAVTIMIGLGAYQRMSQRVEAQDQDAGRARGAQAAGRDSMRRCSGE